MSNNTSYTIWLNDPAGTPLALLDRAESVAWTRALSTAGWWEIVLPGDFDTSLLVIDGILEIWRHPEGGAKTLELSGFLRKITYTTDAEGVTRIIIAGPDANELLKRRIVAYAAGSTNSSRTDEADDLLKALVRDNMSSDASAGRDLTAAGFYLDAEQRLGPSLTYSCAWDDLYGAITDLCMASAGNGTALYWDVKPGEVTGFTLYTYTSYAGQDRTKDVRFGLEWGNLGEPELVQDYTNEATYIFAGGQGEGSERTIVEVENTDRSSRSPWGRREAFVDCRNYSSAVELEDRAYQRLVEGQPALRFSGKLLDTPQAEYGKDWFFGDLVKVMYFGVSYDALVSVVSGRVDASGKETIEARFEIEDVLESGGGVFTP